MKTAVEYLGPYTFTSGSVEGRKFMTVKYSDGSRGTTLYSRYLMSQHLGRTLDPNEETVDHINGDKTDDRISNLQILTRSDHARKDAKPIEWLDFSCPTCLNDFQAQARRYRSNQIRQGKSGPYCSKSCAAKASYSNWKRDMA